MRVFYFAALAVAAAFVPSFFTRRAIAAPAVSISGPVTYGNLAIYFIYGPTVEGPVPLTLQEAMAKGTVHVVETGSVNELRIENAGDEDVYVQSGDIVKGGRQDRVLTASFILPKKSGEVPVAAYCVEHGRWSARGAEDATKFAGSINSLPSREAKIAMKALSQPAFSDAGGAGARPNSMAFSETSQRQHAIWNEVSKTQEKLSAGVNAPVASSISATSLELTLENGKLQALRAEYTRALEGKADENGIVGLAFAVNGRLNSADVYPSNGLFRKMWSKLLAASVTEAIGEKTDSAMGSAPSIEAVRDFLAASETGKAHAQQIGTLAHQVTRDDTSVLFIEAATPSGQWVHRNYLAK